MAGKPTKTFYDMGVIFIFISLAYKFQASYSARGFLLRGWAIVILKAENENGAVDTTSIRLNILKFAVPYNHNTPPTSYP